MDNQNNMGNIIHSLRLSHNLSQKEFALLLNTSQTAVSYWESGQRQPSPKQIGKIARFFSVDLLSLPISTELDENEQYLLAVFRGLNDSGKSKVTDYANILSQVSDFQKKDSDVADQPLDVK